MEGQDILSGSGPPDPFQDWAYGNDFLDADGFPVEFGMHESLSPNPLSGTASPIGSASASPPTMRPTDLHLAAAPDARAVLFNQTVPEAEARLAPELLLGGLRSLVNSPITIDDPLPWAPPRSAWMGIPEYDHDNPVISNEEVRNPRPSQQTNNRELSEGQLGPQQPMQPSHHQESTHLSSNTLSNPANDEEKTRSVNVPPPSTTRNRRFRIHESDLRRIRQGYQIRNSLNYVRDMLLNEDEVRRYNEIRQADGRRRVGGSNVEKWTRAYRKRNAKDGKRK